MRENTIPAIADNVVETDAGFWVSRTTRVVSYPEGDHARCREVEDSSFWFAHRNSIIVELMRQFPPGGIVFDIGGGNGVVTASLSAAGFDSVLVEPGIEGARAGYARGLRPVLCSTLEDAGFGLGALQAAGLFDVVEHVEDDVGFLTRLRAYLHPGGRIYLTVPAFAALWSTDDSHAGHYRRYSAPQFERALREAGFRIEFGTYLFSFLVVPLFLKRTLPSLLKARKVDAAEVEAEHQAASPVVARALSTFCGRELRRVRSGRRIPFGTSFAAVATVCNRS